ncbi:hypothetical protein [Desulfurobacterium sp. TC5-1]|uniref:hypothetical protein n=1 Tax=Desulfurobacterium sp. TC5-1 TaxID=1158318 RepID=UPI0003B3E290|nr:hypothetical protein [Desulfurobacterium sp. TC5-1]
METEKVEEYIFQLERILKMIYSEIKEVPESRELIFIGYLLCESLRTIVREVENGI